MTPEQVDNLFEAFAGASTTRVRGTGLGLALRATSAAGWAARSRVERAGEKLDVHDGAARAGRGRRCRYGVSPRPKLRVPIAIYTPRDDTPVLVIDDDPDVRQLLHRHRRRRLPRHCREGEEGCASRQVVRARLRSTS
jgi:hypothetical protein